ncbi:MAG: helix-turn-helix transcriptional regulator [Firmicutes bacterium]|nr:helix-turn-helix transcriptional regulator [Bacillota bacterium]
MKFCDRLKELRKNSTFTQKELANNLGISVTAYQYYEAGKNQPSIENLIKLADMFNVTLDYLTGRID